MCIYTHRYLFMAPYIWSCKHLQPGLGLSELPGYIEGLGIFGSSQLFPVVDAATVPGLGVPAAPFPAPQTCQGDAGEGLAAQQRVDGGVIKQSADGWVIEQDGEHKAGAHAPSLLPSLCCQGWETLAAEIQMWRMESKNYHF